MDIKRLVRKNILALTPYSTARDEHEGSIGVFLDANESPYDNGYNRYPDPRQRALKSRLAPIKGVGEESIFLGNGSDEAIDLMFRIFCNPGTDNAIAITPSYGMYEVAAAINDVEMCKVELGPGFSLPVDALLAAADSRSKLLFICSPNNPTGNAFPRADIMRLISGFGGIVVVDEAYIDFAAEPGMLGALAECPNLVVLQTLSKAWGMAGLRCGMAFASPYIIGLMNMVKYPYNINVATIEAVGRLLDEPVAERVAEILGERSALAEALAAMPFVERVFPSDANFLLVRVDDADRLYSHLIANDIIVRNRSRVVLCEGCLRITVGTPAENRRLLAALALYPSAL